MPGQSSPFQERSPGWGEGKIFCPHLLCPREDRRSFGPAYGIAPSKQHVSLSRRRHCNTYVTQKYQAQRNTVASLASKVKVDQIMDLLPPPDVAVAGPGRTAGETSSSSSRFPFTGSSRGAGTLQLPGAQISHASTCKAAVQPIISQLQLTDQQLHHVPFSLNPFTGLSHRRP